MQIIPMRDLKNTVEVERRCAEENGPVYVTKNGYGRLVVMDIEYYERTMKKMYEAKALIDGIADAEAARMFPESGTPVENEYLPYTGVRKKLIGNYILYYLPQMSSKTITVLRILYGKRNIDEIIRQLDF